MLLQLNREEHMFSSKFLFFTYATQQKSQDSVKTQLLELINHVCSGYVMLL